MERSEIIPIEKLPFDQFKLLGMERKDVLALPKSTINALQTGNRTSLIQFNNLKVTDIAEPVTLNAKLSLEKVGDSYKLLMHPINLQQKNTLDLSPKEIEFLQKDSLNILPKKVVEKDGTLTDSFISLDKVTNEFVAVKKDAIKSPDSINEIVLSEIQKKDFINGKPIQIGKNNYQLDVNSEQGIAGNNLDKIKFKKGKYNSYNLILDVTLFASGLAPLILIEYLAKIIFNNRKTVNDLLNVDLKPAIDRTVSNIAEKFNNGSELNNKEKNELFIANVHDSLIIKKDEIKLVPADIKKSLETKINIGEIPNYTFVGNLVEHGIAPFEFKNENKENFFLKLDTIAGEKVIWGQDFNRAIQDSNIKVGDRVGINYRGAEKVKMNVDVKDDKGIVTGVKEQTINRNIWNVQSLSQGKEKEITNKAQPGPSEDEIQFNKSEHKSIASFNNPTDNQGKISQIKSEIVAEVKTQNKALEISTKDQNKIHHPEQKEVGETKDSLKTDMNTQISTIAKATSVISKDIAEIVQVKRGMKR